MDLEKAWVLLICEFGENVLFWGCQLINIKLFIEYLYSFAGYFSDSLPFSPDPAVFPLSVGQEFPMLVMFAENHVSASFFFFLSFLITYTLSIQSFSSAYFKYLPFVFFGLK